MFNRASIPFVFNFFNCEKVETSARARGIDKWIQPASLSVMTVGILLTVATTSFALLAPERIPELARLEVSSALTARFFRLGRVATMAIPLLTLLALPYLRQGPSLVWKRQLSFAAQGGFAAGVVAMPTVLFASAFISPDLKYFLAIPAVAVTFAVASVCWLRIGLPSRAETFAWASLAGSLALGLLLGMFAFEGPVPVPSIIDGYSDDIRVFLRTLHQLTITGALMRLIWCRCVRPISPLVQA